MVQRHRSTTTVAVVTHTQSDWTIRPFQRGDAPKARQLIETVWREHFGYHPDPFVRDFIYSRLSDIDEAETFYGDRAIFLCSAEADIIGTGAIKHLDSRECEMTRMFGLPRSWDRPCHRRGTDQNCSWRGIRSGALVQQQDLGGLASSLRKLRLPLYIALGPGRRDPLSLFCPSDLAGLRLARYEPRFMSN
jgi:hypothetical protein